MPNYCLGLHEISGFKWKKGEVVFHFLTIITESFHSVTSYLLSKIVGLIVRFYPMGRMSTKSYSYHPGMV